MHRLGLAYGWTKDDVLRLTYQEIQGHLNLLAEDAREERRSMERAKQRRRR